MGKAPACSAPRVGTMVPSPAHGVCRVAKGSSTHLGPLHPIACASWNPSASWHSQHGRGQQGCRRDEAWRCLLCAARPAPAPRALSWALSAQICGCSCAALGAWPKPRAWCPSLAAPCAGPHVLDSPEGATGSCLPSSAWLNLNQARLLHRSLPAGVKNGQVRPGPGREHCPEPGYLPPAQDPAPPEHPAGPGAGCLPLRLGRCPPRQVPTDTRAAGCGRGWKLPCVEASGARWSQEPLWWDSPGPLCSRADLLPWCRGVHITPSRGMSLLSLSPWTPCTYGVQGTGEPTPQTTAVHRRPRETSRRKEPPGLQPPQEPPCRAHSRWPQVPPQQKRRRALGPGTRGGCVPAAPAAFQEQYCWHQAGSLRRQRIHGPFMRGAGMIYCLGEGAGAGGWSPSVLAPEPSASCVLTAAGPCTREQSCGSGWGVSSRSGMGQSRSPVPCAPCQPPRCPVGRALRMRSLPGHPTASELPLSAAQWPEGHVSLAVPWLMGEVGGDRVSKGGCWGRGASAAQGAGTGTISPC